MPEPVAPRRRRVLLVLLALLGLAVTLLVTGPADAAKPGGKPSSPSGGTAPVRIQVDDVYSDVVIASDLPESAVPRVVVQAGGTFHVRVSFYDASDAPASFNKDTPLTITSSVGTITATAATAYRGEESATIDAHLTDAANQVVLTVGAGSGPKAPSPGTSYDPGATSAPDLRFDVVSELKPDEPSSDGTAFETGIGGDDDCANATKQQPVCEIVMLPRGAGSNVLMSVGACDPDTDSTYAPCFTGARGAVGGAVVQAVFAQPADPYTPTDPVTILVKCDKTLCGTGPIQNLKLTYSVLGNGALAEADECPAKGRTDDDGTPCVDYVQSKRDGSGDTHLYLVTPNDMRVGIG